MLAAAQRLVVPTDRPEVLRRKAVLSALLHALLLASLLVMPRPAPMHEASAPAEVEILPDIGVAEGVKLPAPSYAPSIVAPDEPPATVPPPPATAPSDAIPAASLPTPPMPEAAAPTATAPPVPPTAQATQAAPPPPLPPPAPAAIAELPPPPPAAPPRPSTAEPRPPRPEARPHTAAEPPARPTPARPAPLPFTFGGSDLALPPPPGPRTPDRTASSHGAIDLSLGRQALNSVGAPPRSTHSMDAEIRVQGADVGDDWIQALHEWWDRHAYYPPQAAVNGEDGIVEIHLVIQRDGHVTAVEVVSSSGSRWLDMAGESVFRDAHLRPFPLATPQPRADVYISLHYILVHVHG